MKSYAVYGASGCGRGVMPLLRDQLLASGESEYELVFVDDGVTSSRVNGHSVLTYGRWRATPAEQRFACIAIANSSIRAELARRLAADDVAFLSVRAANAVIMDDVTLGVGAVISPFVTLTSNIRIGAHFHANLYSYVEHDCEIGDFVTFAPGVQCNGNVRIEDHAYVGTGAIIRQGRPGKPTVIGRGAVIGMGAVVTKDVPPGTTVVGNPARPIPPRPAARE